MSLTLNSKKVLLLFYVLLSWQFALSQITTRSHPITRSLEFQYDNDIFLGSDRFYTHGVNIKYSRIINKQARFYRQFRSKRSDSLKVITTYHYGHAVFTGENLRIERIVPLDRPYAGWHYFKFHLMNFPGANSRNRYTVTVGYVGENSGIGNFQEWWHKKFGIVWPRGWENQIANEPVLNLRYDRMYKFQPFKLFGLTGQSTLDAGNGLNQFTQSFILHIGKVNRLVNSGLVNSRLSSILPKVGNTDPEEEEGFFFYKVNFHAVASNILIEGSLFNSNSPHTEELERFYYSRTWGFIYTNYYTTFKFAFHKLSNEFVQGESHRFMSVHLIKRF